MEASLSKTLTIPKLGGYEATEIIRRFPRRSLKNLFKSSGIHFSGEVMQVVLGQILRKTFSGNALSLYRALRNINPSPTCISIIWGISGSWCFTRDIGEAR